MQYKWITLVFGAICLTAVATVVPAQRLYYMAAILLTLPFVSYALGWYMLRGLSFSRELPSSSWEGEEIDIVYKVINASSISRYFLTVQEHLPEWMESVEEESPLFNVAANEETKLVRRYRCIRRGLYQVKEFSVTALDPLGVFAFTKKIPCNSNMLVYPNPAMVSTLPIEGGERFGLQERILASLRGSSIEPDGVRPYVPGDPLRRIHWRQTARTGRLSVVEFEEMQAARLVITLDALAGSNIGKGFDTTLEFSVKLAAGAVQSAIDIGASVRLLTAGLEEKGDILDTGFGRGPEHFHYLLGALASVEATGKFSASSIINQSSPTVYQDVTLLIITSHIDEELPTLIQWLSAAGSRAIILFTDPAAFSRAFQKQDSEALLMKLMAMRADCFRVSRLSNNDMVLENLWHDATAATAY